MARRTTPTVVPLAILAAMLGAAVVFLATPHGLSLRDDSYSYVAGAVSLARGTGFGRVTGDGSVNPITNFPPLTSLVLAIPVKTGIDVYMFARLLNSALFGLTVLAAVVAVGAATNSIGLAAFAAALTLGSGTLIEQFTWIQSEPLFICLELVGLASMAGYIERPARRGLLGLAAIAITLAAYTRFVGLALIIACGLALTLFHRRPFVNRAREAGLVLIVGVAPLIGFTIRNLALKGSAANRPVPFWHPPPVDAWRGALTLSLKWVLPDRIAALLTGSIWMSSLTSIALGVVAAWLILRPVGKMKTSSGPSSATYHLALQALFCLVYLAMIVFTILYLDRLTPLDERILAPLHLSLLVMLALSAANLSRGSSAWGKWSLGAVGLAFAAFQIMRSGLVVESLARDAHGYASERWRTSPTLTYARALPDVPIFSNNLPAMYFVAGRTAYAIPAPMNLSSLGANPDYARELSEMRRLLRETDGFLVYVGYPPTDLQGIEEFKTLTSGLELVQDFSEGSIYRAEG